MDYLVLSPLGLSLFMVPSLGKRTDVGKIYFYIFDKHLNLVGKDLNMLPLWKKLEMVHDPWTVLKEHTKENLTIICDDVNCGPLNDHLRREGWKVVGGTTLTDRLEDDRTFATDLFSRIMSVPESTRFTSFTDGISWLKSQEKQKRFVFKPHDAMVPKDYTYVSKDIVDLVGAMETFKSEWKWEEDFQLQEYVDGVLVDFGGWFNGEEWLEGSHYLYFENKPLLPGDIGPATGGEIAVVFYQENKGVFYDILEKLKPVLKKTGYVGQISVNSMVGKQDKKVYFLELTPRFGYPSFPQDITALEDNGKYLHDLFQALVNKEQKSLFVQKKPVVVVAVSTPPYPHVKQSEQIRGLPVWWGHEYDMYFYPYDVMYDQKKEKMVLTGQDGLALNVTCVDTTVDGATAMLYEKYIPTIHLKNMQYRNDCGDDAKKRIKMLKELGVL